MMDIRVRLPPRLPFAYPCRVSRAPVSPWTAAHTSAGKTVVAEYAIAMAIRDKQRVIYTSPIKALSNQKYRDLAEEFKDVGLMTGDVTINPSATCLVMTTEILRSMLYRGSEVMREVAWVIMDEVHYMKDKDRGVVWEETIILLPHSVRYVFLSATIPNAKEFANWIAQLHSQPCHIVYTDFRPTPLQHYIYPTGGDGLYLIVDEAGTFREDNFNKALAVLDSDGGNIGDGKRKRTKQGKDDYFKIVKMIMERGYDPVIVFGFSRRECEAMALQMSKLDFNNKEEKAMVATVFQSAIDSLNEDDQKLPQIVNILPMLKRGIGIHHSGLLPLLKEVIEILFQEGLIKALFATETFSIGLNMPAKTVVFTNARKFDGEVFRWVSSGEYIQMSGRAGRRGKDKKGIVVLMVDEKMEPHVAKDMVKGAPDPLNSAFHLSYNMLLNLMRIEENSPENIIAKSFLQFQNEQALPGLEARKAELEKEISETVIRDEAQIGELWQVREQIKLARAKVREVANLPLYAVPHLVMPGRVVKVLDGDVDWSWGVVIACNKKAKGDTGAEKRARVGGAAAGTATVEYAIDVLVQCDSGGPSAVPRPWAAASSKGEAEMRVVSFPLTSLDGMSQARLNLPKNLKDAEERRKVGRTLNHMITVRFKDGTLPMLDPVEDMHIEDEDFLKSVKRVEALEAKMGANPLFTEGDLAERFAEFQAKVDLETELKAVKGKIRATQAILMRDDLKHRKRVLRKLDYTDKNNVVQQKGRVACEINTSDELLVTELVFSGIFGKMKPEICAAVLSALVYQEKADDNLKMRDELKGPLRQVQDVARLVAEASIEAKMEMDADDYCASFKGDLMEPVLTWCQGAKFIQICNMTPIFEGSIIRCMRRLEELMRQLGQAAHSIGDTDLEEKFNAGIEKLKRDIVFSASLYL